MTHRAALRNALVAALASISSACGSGGEGAALATSAPVVAQPPTDGSAEAAVPTASPTITATTVVEAAPAETASAEPETPAAPTKPLPEVEVKNIGMHIGGGPNDTVTKAPIKRSVEPHFQALQRCYAEVEEPKTGDVSLDLRIERDGGLAKLTKYKSALRGEAFEACVREVFAKIEFEKPKTGTTVVSYSLRFTPKKR